MIESFKNIKEEKELSKEEIEVEYHSFLEKIRLEMWEYHTHYHDNLKNLKNRDTENSIDSDYNFFINQRIMRVKHERDRILRKKGIETLEPDFSFLNDKL